MSVRALFLTSLAAFASTAAGQDNPLARLLRGKRYAVVVGIERYADSRIPPARFADRDAAALAEVLRDKLKSPYEVTLLTNQHATRDAILAALERVSRACTPQDTFLVFLACHGIPWHGEVFLAPADMGKLLSLRGIPLQALVRRYLVKCPAAQKVVLLDTCFSGVAVTVDENDTVHWGRGERTRGFAGVSDALVRQDPSLAIITAAGPGQSSYSDPASRHGFFTERLLEALLGRADQGSFGNRDGLLTGDEIYAYLCERVRQDVKQRFHVEQMPMRLFRGARLVLGSIEPAHFTLTVRSQPPGALVSVNYQDRGRTPFTMQGDVGKLYRIQLVLDGYATETLRIRARGEEPVERTVRLTRLGQRASGYELALRYLRGPDPALGERMLAAEARSNSPDAARAAAELVSWCLKHGRVADARDWADLLRSRFPDSEESDTADRALYRLLAPELEAGDNLAAQRASIRKLETFCKQNPGNRYVEDARRRIRAHRQRLIQIHSERVTRLARMARDAAAIQQYAVADAALAAIRRIYADAQASDHIQLASGLPDRLARELASAREQEAGRRQQLVAQMRKLHMSGALPPGFENAFMLPDSDTDQYGNPVVTRNGSRFDPETGWAYEIWLKGGPITTIVERKKGWLFKTTVREQVTIRLPRMEFVLIPAGEFLMGSPDGEGDDDEHPQHRVRITQPFYLGKYEVTNGQYRAFLKSSGYDGSGDADSDYLKHFRGKSDMPTEANYPIVWVSWKNSSAFCEWLSRQAGVEVRLPTEAQWEYACRAGARTPWSFGSDSSALSDYAWYGGNSDGKTHPVGQKQPNPWGLYDMHGNVWEWCHDWYDENYYSHSPTEDPAGPSSGEWRAVRGGSWSVDPWYVRSAIRDGNSPGNTGIDYGFRLAVAPR